ncbi:DUF3888 domain-containing protein [Konateibacter massiliensis]|uniref:DUF3888 domain-containing protein n=1 Tax=Konateibacter massiliensis TaxID=2002841 RepID=UPI000C157DD0|nr:DUF3888 domain-containing protein [Konateibacter massiliensis]
MLHLIHINKKNTEILFLLCLAILSLTYYLFIKDNSIKAQMTTTMHSYETESEYDKLLINTYLNAIQQATNVFYSQYYTINPTVAYYVVTVKEIKSESKPGTENTISMITFVSEPYIGPHDTIGRDEITFSASYTGDVEIEKFEHILSYHLPENLKDLERKTVPGEYAD